MRMPAAACAGSDADCDDGKMCNGRERCAPQAKDADARGCVRGTPVSCPVNQICVEGQGCRGAEASRTAELRAEGRPRQTCAGRDVLLSGQDGNYRTEHCPTGTACIEQPNGSGICAPVAR
jgi:hypothetical protein